MNNVFITGVKTLLPAIILFALVWIGLQNFVSSETGEPVFGEIVRGLISFGFGVAGFFIGKKLFGK